MGGADGLSDQGFVFEANETIEVLKSFDEIGLKDDILRGVFAYGFDRPSAVQQRAIRPIMRGRDVIVQSQSGTGKTSVFCLGALQAVDFHISEPQALLISPTRELAEQSAKVCKALGDYVGVKIHTCVGGKAVKDNVRALKQGAHIVSGTPGRVLAMIQQHTLPQRRLKMLVIDEADEMMTKGFKQQVHGIHRLMPPKVQVILVSATMPEDVLEITETFMTNPFKLLVRQSDVSLECIRQFYIPVEQEKWKFDTLCDLYDSLTVTQTVIFCNNRKKVDWLAAKMKAANFPIAAIHGDMPQKERDAIMDGFRVGKSRQLIATDLIGRGVDVSQVSLVINYDVPASREFYIHRIGRSGRFGRKGVAINLAKEEEMPLLADLQKHYKTKIEELPGNFAQLI
mmetsp:Transcript_3107/g.6851  ORF Transcript_3107/g.6851 Transcript_3107/m.6851 type:complete len:398 (-) Transcript_3107:46-1239(-)|eukprot:CAMPEP_0206620796 /NCGR_PEP_ID=MMETSP0325_2-20121206/61846_1 /ASSEMBLY_ACC=CAM_ASM_000347 /TAXON_ID=2866 /ORGANISM="Crypthecodinium cohnii, Strain Seligo" /LENGTH=397 /DNA_ID=CAMNT_0054143843 /DNA_START=196 /DNA_END=1389 /DNA_ORIENTATION=-